MDTNADPEHHAPKLQTPPTIVMVAPVKSHSENERKSTFEERVRMFQEAIQGELNLSQIRTLAFGGIPEFPGLRATYWKILLNYLPDKKKDWPSMLTKNHTLYREFLDMLIIDPRKLETPDDHPLSDSKTSHWNAFFHDNELLEEIDKDVKRTLPHLHFFNHDKQQGSTEHYEALKRILFIYAKLNPGIKYVQGMNEILGPIYYIFASSTAEGPAFPEADAFFCFTNLMSEIRDHFCKALDKSDTGVQGLMNKHSNLLKIKDPELWEDFQDKGLNPQFYGFRWLTLLLSQEFDLPDVLRLWDSFFADENRFEFLLYVSCAMLVCVREQLLDTSFAENLKMLQSYPGEDIHVILRKAEELQNPGYTPPPVRPKISIQHHQQQQQLSDEASFLHWMQTRPQPVTHSKPVTKDKVANPPAPENREEDLVQSLTDTHIEETPIVYKDHPLE